MEIRTLLRGHYGDIDSSTNGDICNFGDILRYIIIIYCCTPIGNVVPSFRDVIIVYAHWGKPYVVQHKVEYNPQVEYNKMYFCVSLGEFDPISVRGWPSKFIRSVPWFI